MTVTSNARVGFFHCNAVSYVANDCVIDNYVSFVTSVRYNGNVLIEDNFYIHFGISIIQGKQEKPLPIGRGANVSLGAIVTKKVAPGMTVFVNPARPLT
ncbi:MAG: hypothetical protein PHO08_02945 [Methylococcales bacterium]|nr:hypothetical protein [Methylococcales bacterium]